jgi:hypothetical protein
MMGKFVRIPHVWGRRLQEHRVNAVGWYLLCELDRLIHEPGRGIPVKLSTEVLKRTGLGYWEAYRALCQLEKAGAVAVTRHQGRAPVVRPLWYWEPVKKVTQNRKKGHAK